MSHSLSYKIALAVLKMMGIKKTFSQDPIDFKKVRKQDIHAPKGSFFKSNSKAFTVSNTSITEINGNAKSPKLVLFIHGGAFISGPIKNHWDAARKIAQDKDCPVWICDYPKAPENDIVEISKNIDEVYKEALAKYSKSEITLIGDSVGGTLIAALTQRLIESESKLPNKIILISPVMDASLSNPEIDRIDNLDPMLSKKGVRSAKKMCAQDMELSNPMISPLNGSFEGFPNTVLFLGSHDITYPDQKLALEKMRQAQVEVEAFNGEEMPHIWPILPVMKEAKLAFKEILNRL